MSKKFTNFLEEKLMPLGGAIGTQKHLAAVKDGMLAVIPLTIIGGLSLIVAFPPIDPSKVNPNNLFLKPLLAWATWASANMGAILTPYNMTMALMAIFAAMAISYSLAKSHELDAFGSAVTSGVIFLLVAGTSRMAVFVENMQKGGDVLKQAIGVLPANFFDAKGLFTAIIVGLVTVEVARLLVKKGITIKMPDGVPPAVASSFNSLIPMAVNIIIFYTISLVLKATVHMSFPETIMQVLSPAIGSVNNIWGFLFLLLFAQIMWLIGIHGMALILPIVMTLGASNIMANAAAKVAGHSMPFIITDSFWYNFVIMSGSGATMALTLMMLKSNSDQLKMVGRLGILPALFNINEPVIFGSPIVTNPILGIPFILAPVANLFIAYGCTVIGLVRRCFVSTPWTTPAFVGAGLATTDIKAVLLVFVLIAVDFIIYYPFFKIYEKTLVKVQQVESGNETTIASF